MAAIDSAGRKAGPRGRSSRKPADKFIIGTEAEVQNRTNTLVDWAPDQAAPAFVQIKPESSTGKSINRAPLNSRSGDLKFSKGIGRP